MGDGLVRLLATTHGNGPGVVLFRTSFPRGLEPRTAGLGLHGWP